MSPAAWPRYRVLRSLDIGQYNLEISNAELSDDSLYECQATEAALRSRRAKLNVLSKWICDRYKFLEFLLIGIHVEWEGPFHFKEIFVSLWRADFLSSKDELPAWMSNVPVNTSSLWIHTFFNRVKVALYFWLYLMCHSCRNLRVFMSVSISHQHRSCEFSRYEMWETLRQKQITPSINSLTT